MGKISEILGFVHRAGRILSKNFFSRGKQSIKEPQFEEIVIFYNYIFDLGDFVNPTDVARRLLDKEFALSAANYLTDDIEVATRFKELARLRSGALHLSDIYQHLETKGIRGVVGWVLKHPIRAWQLWRTMRRARSSQSQEHPDHETEPKGIQGVLEGVVEFVDEAMMRIQMFEALQRHVDRSLFTPLYLCEVPFTRVGLQPLFATMAGQRVDVDVAVLIHRTGVAILTFYALFDGQKSADELLALQKATEVQIEHSEIVRAIVEPQARVFGLRSSDLDKAPFERRYSGGVEWFIYREQEKVTLTDLFELYQIAIVSAVHGKEPSKPTEPWSWLRTPDWFAYPIVFIRRIIPPVPNDEAFKRQYPGLLAGLVQRFPQWQEMKKKEVQEAIEADLSMMQNYSLYVGSSHTTVLYYEPCRQSLISRHGEDVPGQEWLVKHFQTSAVVDVLLIQRWILHTLNYQLHNLGYSLRKLNALKRNLLLALEEYHGITLSYGTAQDIVRQARETMGITEMYENIMQKVSSVERLIEVEETRRRTSRDLLLRIGAIVATLLFGLSGAWQVVRVVSDWNSLPTEAWGGLDGTVLKSVADLVQAWPIPASLFLYLILIGIIMLIIIWGLRPSRKHRPILDVDQSEPAYTRGFIWPARVEIVRRNETGDCDSS
jgi:hypothetical protein